MSLQRWTRRAEGAESGRDRRWRAWASTLLVAVLAPALVTVATSSCSDDNGFGAKPPGPPLG
jgi:hypothetical protein